MLCSLPGALTWVFRWGRRVSPSLAWHIALPSADPSPAENRIKPPTLKLSSAVLVPRQAATQPHRALNTVVPSLSANHKAQGLLSFFRRGSNLSVLPPRCHGSSFRERQSCRTIRELCSQLWFSGLCNYVVVTLQNQLVYGEGATKLSPQHLIKFTDRRVDNGPRGSRQLTLNKILTARAGEHLLGVDAGSAGSPSCSGGGDIWAAGVLPTVRQPPEANN